MRQMLKARGVKIQSKKGNTKNYATSLPAGRTADAFRGCIMVRKTLLSGPRLTAASTSTC